MTINVYGKTRGCPQCDATKRKLGKMGVQYNFIDVDVDKAAFDYIIGLGYQQVPVVVTPTEHYSGYRPDKLAGLIAHKETA